MIGGVVVKLLDMVYEFMEIGYYVMLNYQYCDWGRGFFIVIL